MTAYGTVDDAVTAVKSGAFSYIEKPVNPAKLAELINTAWSRDGFRNSSHRKGSCWARPSQASVPASFSSPMKKRYCGPMPMLKNI
jgi:DNA-binding NtrC family response regulator